MRGNSVKRVKFAELPPTSKEMVLNFTDGVQILAGPVGTGKTISLGLKLLVSALSIKPQEDGVRRTRFIVFRRRYGDLEASIAKDLGDIVAPGLFRMSSRKSPMYGEMKFRDERGPVECEVYFYAFETEADVAKIKSMKFTCGFGPEAQEHVSHKILKGVYERLGRYPTNENIDVEDDATLEYNRAIAWRLPNGGDEQGPFLALDINYPSRHHWMWNYMVGNNKVQPDTGRPLRAVHRQPPTHIFVPDKRLDRGEKGVEGIYRGQSGAFVRNPEARRYIVHQGWQYWESLIREMMGDDALIQQNILAEFGTASDGLPVYPVFADHRHVSETPLEYLVGVPVYIGADNGHNNAWIFMQKDPSNGVIRIVHEIVNVGAGAKTVKMAIDEDVLPYISQTLVPMGVQDIVVITDQAFLQREGGYGNTQMDVLSDAGLVALPCPEKYTTPMRDIVTDQLRTNKILVSLTCTWVTAAFSGEFKYKMKEGIKSSEPVKNDYSHPAEAAEIGITGIIKPLSGKNRRRTGKGKYRNYSPI
jgi:hypothetical protein